MGGAGSGGISRHGVVEQSFRLDLAPLLAKAREHGDGFFGVMQRDGGRVCSSVERIEAEMSVGPETGFLRLRYIAVTHRGQIIPVSVRIDLVSAAQPFGGRQWWMRCPVHRRRVKALFLPYGAAQFACREAWRLNYACQRRSAKDRALATAQRIRQQLGGDACVFDAFPERPARMRQARYDKLRAKAEAASQVSMTALWAYLDRVHPQGRRCRAGA